MKPYYQHAGVTIYHGDCRDVLPHVGDIGLVLSDPPYGISHPTNYAARGRDRLAPCRDYLPVAGDGEKFDPASILDLGVPTILWGANYFADLLPVVSGWLVWDKKRPHDLDQATAELAWSNTVKGARVFRHLWNGMMRESERGKSYHPTQKPVALMSWCLNLKGVPPDGVVLDPYMGAGPVLRAAKDMGRKAIGIELEEGYCEIAANRLAQEVLF